MNDNRSFADGFIDGWRSIRGKGAALPGIPAYALPAGKTHYQHGFEVGKAKAEERQRQSSGES